MPDTRHLKRRTGARRSGQRWYVQVAVPKELQGKLGHKTVERALKTSDLREAQRQRWAVLAEIEETFKRAREELGLTSVEIEAAAQRQMRESLEAIRRDPGDFFEPVPGDVDHGLIGEGLLGDMQYDLAEGDYARVAKAADVVKSRAGASLSDEQKDELGQALLRADIEALRAALALHGGEEPNPPRVLNARAIDPVTLERPSPGRVIPRHGAAPPITEAAERYFADQMRDPSARWTRQTEMQYRASARLFADFAQDAPIDAVTREEAAGFLSTIGRLHRNYGRSKKARGLHLDELLARSPGPPHLSNATLNRHSRALHGLFKWAAKVGLREGENPFAGQQRPTGRQSRTGWEPYTVEELNALFGHALLTETSRDERVRPGRHSMQTALRWVPLVALFSGMRQGEICELAVGDVREEEGVAFLDVTAAKSEAGVRRVPVHPQLVRAGFLDYLEHVRGQGHEHLFPGLKPGGPDGKRNWYFAKAFTTYRRACGVTREHVGFHSLRKNVVQALERARLHQSEVAQLVGHERGFTFSVYSPRGLDLKGLRRVVEKISYPGLKLRRGQAG